MQHLLYRSSQCGEREEAHTAFAISRSLNF